MPHRNWDLQSLARSLFRFAGANKWFPSAHHSTFILHPRTGPLTDAWVKLDWAKHHVDKLKTEIRQWGRSKEHTTPFEIDREFNAGEGCFIDRIGKLKSVPPAWPLEAGDILHNLRTALEYVAWQAVHQSGKPKPGAENYIGFPIFADRKNFHASKLGKLLPGIKLEYLAIIEKYQPYNRNPSSPKDHCLAILNELDRFDKHRELQLVLLYTKTYTARLTTARNFRNARLVPPPVPWAGIPQLGTELARVYGQPTPGKKPKVSVQYKGAASVAFEQGWFVESTLDDIGVEIAAILSAFEPLL